jgi:hypothetical protein
MSARMTDKRLAAIGRLAADATDWTDMRVEERNLARGDAYDLRGRSDAGRPIVRIGRFIEGFDADIFMVVRPVLGELVAEVRSGRERVAALEAALRIMLEDNNKCACGECNWCHCKDVLEVARG